MKASILKRIKKIKLLIMDVDGVMTKGEIVVDDKGKETKVFDVQDGFAIVLFRQAGYKTAIISARASGAVKARARDLKIDKVYVDAYPKETAYRKLLSTLKLEDEQVCFMADDLPDLKVFQKVGLAVAVSNAVEEILKAAHYTTLNPGGQGAVREVVELILKTQGQWDRIVKSFS